MRRGCLRAVTWVLLFALLVAGSPLPAQTASGSTAVGKAVDTMINYDYKSYAGRIVIESIAADQRAGRSIDWAKIGRELTARPFLTNMAIGGGSEVVGTAIQLGSAGLFPPFGLIAGSVVSATLNSFGGALGYETGAAMRSGEALTPRQILGRAMVNIDMPEFIGRTTGSTIGAIAGQALIPIPVVGMVIGGLVGGIAGNLAVTALRKVPALAKAFDSLQARWQRLGQSLLAGGTASGTPAANAGGGATGNNPFGDATIEVKPGAARAP